MPSIAKYANVAATGQYATTSEDRKKQNVGEARESRTRFGGSKKECSSPRRTRR